MVDVAIESAPRRRLTPEQRRAAGARRVQEHRERKRQERLEKEREAAGLDPVPENGEPKIEGNTTGSPAPLVQVNVAPSKEPSAECLARAKDEIRGALSTCIVVAGASNPIYTRVPFPESSMEAIVNQWAPIVAEYIDKVTPTWLRMMIASVVSLGLFAQWRQACLEAKPNG